jgi:hypothetical protein
MEVGGLYNFVLMIAMIGILLGVVLTIVGQLSTSTGIKGTTAQLSLNQTVSAMSPMATTWMPLVTTVAVLGIVLTIVLNSFSNR